MTEKKYLSKKKTAHQSISISPALKDWIQRYVNVHHRKDPNDERFKSVSSFITYILDNVMNLFKEGKTIEDFKRLEDQIYKDFFDKFTFKATIPLYDMVAESNRFTPISFNFITRFLMAVYQFYKSIYLKEKSPKGWIQVFERFKNRTYPSNITKELKLEVFPEREQGFGKGYLEFVGKQRNLHFENCKFFAGICGILGLRVTDFHYSSKDFYGRLDLIETPLAFREELVKKERIKLLQENVNFVINYNRMLIDKDRFLWMNLAEDNDIYICFKTKNAFNKWIGAVEKDLRKFGSKEDFLNKIIQFFNKLHWIRIENLVEYSFRIEKALENNSKQQKFLLDYLSKFSEITQSGEIYQLK
ncbi:MAG: hypothetical protein ACFFE5_02795 [Candidatus Thorarchaeota archaeon]